MREWVERRALKTARTPLKRQRARTITGPGQRTQSLPSCSRAHMTPLEATPARRKVSQSKEAWGTQSGRAFFTQQRVRIKAIRPSGRLRKNIQRQLK